MTTCCVDECAAPRHARGWCGRHYQMWTRHGDPLYVAPTGLETFWDRVNVGSTTDCWEWTGSRMPSGYGQPYIRLEHGGPRVRCLAHRIAYELYYGSPAVNEVCHRCDNPPCCNPHHLYDGTHAENMRDAKERGLLVRGENHRWSKVTEEQARTIRDRFDRGDRRPEIAAEFGVSVRTVYDIGSGRSWGWLP